MILVAFLVFLTLIGAVMGWVSFPLLVLLLVSFVLLAFVRPQS